MGPGTLLSPKTVLEKGETVVIDIHIMHDARRDAKIIARTRTPWSLHHKRSRLLSLAFNMTKKIIDNL